MNEIKIFNNPYFGEIRTAVNENNDPLFCLSDVARALGYSNAPKAVIDHCKGVTVLETPTNGGIQQIKFGKESEVYRLVMKSKLPEAETFQDWVCEEVLPSIRKSGGYIATLSEDTPEIILARAILVANDAIERLKSDNAEKARLLAVAQNQLEYQAPTLKYANEVLSSTSCHTATTIGAELNMSAIILNRLLVKAHFIRKTGKKSEYSLCAVHQGKGYVVTSTHKYVRADDTVGSNIDIHFTEKGRMKIHEITGRAITAGVLTERKGRYFINNSWVPAAKQA